MKRDTLTTLTLLIATAALASACSEVDDIDDGGDTGTPVTDTGPPSTDIGTEDTAGADTGLSEEERCDQAKVHGTEDCLASLEDCKYDVGATCCRDTMDWIEEEMPPYQRGW